MNTDIKHLYEHGFLNAKDTVIALLTMAGWDKDGATAVLAEIPAPQKKNRKWTNADRDALKEAYESGTPVNVILTTFGITKNQLVGQRTHGGWRRPEAAE